MLFCRDILDKSMHSADLRKLRAKNYFDFDKIIQVKIFYFSDFGRVTIPFMKLIFSVCVYMCVCGGERISMVKAMGR